MPYLNPDDYVYTLISLPRWQKEWIKSKHSINFSGLVQEVLIKIISQKDPDYFQEYEHLLQAKPTKRRENTVALIQSLSI